MIRDVMELIDLWICDFCIEAVQKYIFINILLLKISL